MNFQQFAQLLVSGVIAGSMSGLLGLGFGLILGVTGRFHFAFAVTFTITAYAAITAAEQGVPLVFALPIGLVAGALLGILIEWQIYRPLVGNSPALALLGVFITSLGLAIIGENGIRLIWSSHSKVLDSGFPIEGISVEGVTFTSLDVVSVLVVWVVVAAVWALLTYTQQGRVINSVRVNPEMARVVGIDPDRVYLAVFALGSALGGIAALLTAMKYVALPEMGTQPTSMAFVVAFLAGLTSGPWRFLLTGIILGVVGSLSGLVLSPNWTPVVVFSILFLYVASRPLFVNGGLNLKPRRRRQPKVEVG